MANYRQFSQDMLQPFIDELTKINTKIKYNTGINIQDMAVLDILKVIIPTYYRLKNQPSTKLSDILDLGKEELSEKKNETVYQSTNLNVSTNTIGKKADSDTDSDTNRKYNNIRDLFDMDSDNDSDDSDDPNINKKEYVELKDQMYKMTEMQLKHIENTRWYITGISCVDYETVSDHSESNMSDAECESNNSDGTSEEEFLDIIQPEIDEDLSNIFPDVPTLETQVDAIPESIKSLYGNVNHEQQVHYL
jgi:hypothetical protein